MPPPAKSHFEKFEAASILLGINPSVTEISFMKDVLKLIPEVSEVVERDHKSLSQEEQALKSSWYQRGRWWSVLKYSETPYGWSTPANEEGLLLSHKRVREEEYN